MVTIRRRKTGKNDYFYLEHTIREGKNILKKERYIGKSIPKNIEQLKNSLLHDIYKERWNPLFEKIRKNYCRDIKKTPESAKDKNLRSFAVRFTYDTQRIEGSTLTLRETADLLEKGITPGNRKVEDVKEAELHSELFYAVLRQEKDLSLQSVLYWHKNFLGETKPDIAGRIRIHQVLISGSRFTPPFPAELFPLLKDFFKWYNKNKNKLHPVELAARAHLKFVTIHPFADGNGRISRLMMNFTLHRHGYPMMNIEYRNRSSYYTALERAQVKKQDQIFVQWFFKRYVKEHKKYN